MLILSWKDATTGEQKTVKFDAVTAESHEAVMSITSHPVEKGASVTDHSTEETDKITIEAFVSDKPLYSNPGVAKDFDYTFTSLDIPEKSGGASLLSPGGATQAVTGAVRSLLDKPSNKAIVLKANGDAKDRGRAIFNLLESARTTRSLVRISTRIRDVENMLIERIGVPRTPETAGGMPFQVDLRKVRIVESQLVDAPQPAEARGQGEASKGSRTAKEDDAKKAQEKSLAAAGYDGAAGFFGK